MKLRFLLLIAVVLSFAGCGAYKQLQPKPVLSPAENGYIELKNGKKDFEIKKDGKYFIQFPSPQDNNFFLVLTLPQKKKLNNFMSASLIDKKKYGDVIKDISSLDTESVFPMQQNSTGYYLLIDHVSENMILKVNYRYVPQWRFKFENKYAQFLDIAEKNKVDRSIYNKIGNGYHLEGIMYNVVSDSVKKHTAELNSVYKELLEIESIFPKGILNSKDTAYQNYLKLKSDIEDEMTFQENYVMVLGFFGKEFSCRGNPAEYIKGVDEYTDFFSKKDRFPSTIISEAQTVITGRMAEVVPFFDQRLSGKDDPAPFDDNLYMISYLYRIRSLYESAGLATSPEYNALAKFVKDFNAKSISLTNARDTMKNIINTVTTTAQMPGDDFFRIAVKKASTVQSSIPDTINDSYGKYLPFRSASKLNAEIISLKKDVDKSLAEYKEAEALVPQLNVLKNQKSFSTMLGMLKQNAHLTFLTSKYTAVDKMSVDEQSNNVKAALEGNSWAQSEDLLRKLHEDINFLNPADIYPIKKTVVDNLEDALYTRIDQASRTRINQFCDANVSTLENVDSLYSDSVFVPVYNVTFSSGSKAELVQRKNNLIADLQKMKDDEFPARAIKQLYEQFTANPSENGVLKARAVVTHGKHYKADDKKTKQRIAECDPYSVKWIVKPKEYRRAFVLPVTDSKRGDNKYIVRFNIDIETEANFPVYDVNIKLPRELANNAANTQWYESITLNKVPLKNEGRFVITAPSAANDYECQITPVQMNKDKSNILEIVFKDNTFKVYTFSVMVQKPIIKKN